MTLFNRQTAQGRCPCGAAHASCGPPSSAIPVDQNFEEVAAVSGPLKRYRYTSASGAETVLKFNQADAERHGLTDDDVVGAVPAVEEKAVAEAPNKARSASANKGRAPRGKGGPGGGG